MVDHNGKKRPITLKNRKYLNIEILNFQEIFFCSVQKNIFRIQCSRFQIIKWVSGSRILAAIFDVIKRTNVQNVGHMSNNK